MSKSEYEWEIGGELPILRVHSIAKHQVIESYVENYIKILAPDPRYERLQLSIIDGFAGGGLYRHEETGETCLGSPLLLLNAVKSAEAAINAVRKKPFNVNADFFFVDKNHGNIEHLKYALRENGHDWQSDEHINIFQGPFEDFAPGIIKQIQQRGKAWRSIFILDQYGYSDVPLPLINKIFQDLPNAEVILTFASDALVNYINDTDQFKQTMSKVGFDSIRWDRIKELKAESADWKYIIQTQVSRALQAASGAKYYTPFFIHSRNSHRDYWLVHLSSHARARDEMVQLHWNLHNHFSHPGGAGLNMLGYHPSNDSNLTGQDDFEFLFDDNAHARTSNALVEELPILIYVMPEGIAFEDLILRTCNETPASSHIYKEALEQLMDIGDINITGPDGQTRRKGSAIKSDDIIKPAMQRRFIL